MFEKEVVMLLGLASVAIFAMIFIRQLYTIAVVGLLVLTPFGNWSVMPRSVLGIPGLNIVNFVWLAAFLYTVALILVNRQKWRLLEFFQGPILILLGVYYFAALRTIVDIQSLGAADSAVYAHVHYGTSLVGRVMEDFIKPTQFVLTGWIVLVYLHVKGGKENIHKGLMITAILMALVVTSYYAIGLVELGHYSKARLFVTAHFGLHPNNIARIVILLFLAIMFARLEVSPALRVVALFAALLTITVAMSRAVYVVLVVMLLFHYREISRGERKVLAVIFAVIFAVFANDIVDRVKYGIAENSETDMGTSFRPQSGDSIDLDKLSASRLDSIWVKLFPEIEERPLIGNGLHAIVKSAAAKKGELFTLSTHSAVMEALVDCGALGLGLIFFSFYWMRVRARPFRSELFYLVIPVIVLGISDPSYYPRLPTYLVYIYYAICQYDLAREREISERSKLTAAAV